jgi:hypothetical protein
MTLPNYDQNQLTSYYEQQMLKRDTAKRDHGHDGTGFWWYGYPISTNTQMAFGAPTNAETTVSSGQEATAAVTTQVGGNVIADAGLQ